MSYVGKYSINTDNYSTNKFLSLFSLQVEKNELRDEKLRLKASKEKLELQIKASAAQPALLAHHSAMGVAFAKEAGNKLVPFFGYPGVAMWQFMQPAVVDTSQDHVLRPPVA